MYEPSQRTFAILLSVILFLQCLAGLLYINYPFLDGRLHYNWGPPFWLLRAKAINDVGLTSTYFGLKDYSSHPQLIGPVIALWTSLAGYSEISIRFLSLLLTLITTFFLTLAVRNFTTPRRALAFAVLFAALPLIYIYGRKLDQEALVLVFLAIHMWGLSLIETNTRKALRLVCLGSLGMALSDWSGPVFSLSTTLALFCIWKWSEHKQLITRFAVGSLGASGAGLLLFLFQSYFQAEASSVSEFIHPYYEQWLYRAGFNGDFSWLGWTYQQFQFLSANYSIPAVLIACIALVLSLQKKYAPHHTSALRQYLRVRLHSDSVRTHCSSHRPAVFIFIFNTIFLYPWRLVSCLHLNTFLSALGRRNGLLPGSTYLHSHFADSHSLQATISTNYSFLILIQTSMISTLFKQLQNFRSQKPFLR